MAKPAAAAPRRYSAALAASPLAFHRNRHRRAGGDRVELTASHGDWLAALDASLAAGRRVVVASNSLAEARAVNVRFPDHSHADRVETVVDLLDVIVPGATLSAVKALMETNP